MASVTERGCYHPLWFELPCDTFLCLTLWDLLHCKQKQRAHILYSLAHLHSYVLIFTHVFTHIFTHLRIHILAHSNTHSLTESLITLLLLHTQANTYSTIYIHTYSLTPALTHTYIRTLFHSYSLTHLRTLPARYVKIGGWKRQCKKIWLQGHILLSFSERWSLVIHTAQPRSYASSGSSQSSTAPSKQCRDFKGRPNYIYIYIYSNLLANYTFI